MSFRVLGFAVLCAMASIPLARADIVCTALVDTATGAVLRMEGDCGRRATPASTFKIAISLMGFDAGFLKDRQSPALPFREGYPDWVASWRTTTNPEYWMKNSVVWYSQEITRHLGEERFHDYMAAFDYGNGNVSGNVGKKDGLTRSWLSSSLAISPIEQLAFLRRVVQQKIGVSAHAREMTARIMALGVLPNGWAVHGKTGAGFPVNPDGSTNRARPFGWFVGWATKGERSVAFVRLVQDEKRQAVSPGIRTREALMLELPEMLDAL